MKRFAFLLVVAGLFAAVSVSYAQGQSPPTRSAVLAIENHHITLTEDPATLETQIKPECQEQAFAETVQLAMLPEACAADADYGSCSLVAVMNKNVNSKKLFVFRSTIYHSSGGMPL